MEALGTRAEILIRSQTDIVRQIFVLPTSLKKKALIQKMGFQVIGVCMEDEESKES